MDSNMILSHVDHTILAATATWPEVKKICTEAAQHKMASACIPPSFVKQAKECIGDRVKICTVIGFPLGYSTTEAKKAETADALSNGADEIDMVVNLGWVKQGDFDAVEQEIAVLKQLCGDRVLKVIVETCYLTEAEKEALCGCVTAAGADFIKTSTGFGTAGAKAEDVELFKKHIGPNVRIKASGGVRTAEDFTRFLQLGCERIGASSASILFEA